MQIQVSNTDIVNSDNITYMERVGNVLTFHFNDGTALSVPYLDATQAVAFFTSIGIAINTNKPDTVPVITLLYPTTGAAAGGDVIVVTGFNFLAGFDFFINNMSSGHINVDPRTIYYQTPANAPGTYDAKYQGVDGQIAILPNAFTYV